MRILILSCNTGEGHNSAAKALQDRFTKEQIHCEIQDALAFWSPKKSKIISQGHVFIYRRLPKLFGASYRFEENHMKEGGEGLIYDLVTRGCDSLHGFLQAGKYDAILCTHVFSAMMMTDLKKRYPINIPCYFVSTDYTCSPGVNQSNLEYYFIPHENLTEEFVRNGIPQEKLIPSGIPIRESFFSGTDPILAKKTLSLPPDKKIVLLMCGSMGCGPIKELAELLPAAIPEDAMLVVICGNNNRLYQTLTKKTPPKNLRVIGYTTRMPLYMDAASLILTKPGGLSSTEAAAKAVPMVLLDAVPGCETRNMEFFTANGFAETSRDPEVLCKTVCDYLTDEEKRTARSALLHEHFSKSAAACICEVVTGNILTT